MTTIERQKIRRAFNNLKAVTKCGCMDEPAGEGMDEEHKTSILAAQADLAELLMEE